MPRAGGVYTLPPVYLAVAGTTINPAQHNSPLEDVAAALTNSVPVDGSAPMVAPLKLADGSAGSPSLTFNSLAGIGMSKTASGLGFSVGGSIVFEITAAGPVVTGNFTVPGFMTANVFRANTLGTAAGPTSKPLRSMREARLSETFATYEPCWIPVSSSSPQSSCGGLFDG